MKKPIDEDLNFNEDGTSGTIHGGLSVRKINVNKDTEDDDEWSTGTAALDVEQLAAWLAVVQKKQLRDGERQFGPVPLTEDPDSVFNKPSQTQGHGESIQPHPLLTKSQQFSGDDPKITARSSENNKASERFVKERLENQLRHQLALGHQPKRRITLSRY